MAKRGSSRHTQKPLERDALPAGTEVPDKDLFFNR